MIGKNSTKVLMRHAGAFDSAYQMGGTLQDAHQEPCVYFPHILHRCECVASLCHCGYYRQDMLGCLVASLSLVRIFSESVSGIFSDIFSGIFSAIFSAIF
jgi:hypothetical protein